MYDPGFWLLFTYGGTVVAWVVWFLSFHPIWLAVAIFGTLLSFASRGTHIAVDQVRANETPLEKARYARTGNPVVYVLLVGLLIVLGLSICLLGTYVEINY